MSISDSVRNYLDAQGAPYDVVHHPRTSTSTETVATAHLPADQLAKSVVVEDKEQCLMVLIPSTQRLRFVSLREWLGHPFVLATEEELQTLFKDCEAGSIPALGQAYGMQVLVDDALLDVDEVYFEAGDHTELVHMSGQDFRALMAQAGHGHFGHDV